MKKAGTRTLETSRLILRRFTIEDSDDMYKNWASDSEVTEFLTWSPHPNVDFTRQLLKGWISKYEDGAYFNWVIELNTKLTPCDDDNEKVLESIVDNY